MSFFITIFCCPYDYAGNITETTDGEGNKITYEYNLINRLKQITDQAGEKDCFSYDSEGRIKNHIDRNGNRVSYNYNIYGSLTEKAEQNTGLSELYEYHTDGTLKAAIASGMRYGYSYYPDGRLKEKSASGKTLLAYEYDLNGNKIRQSDVTGKTTQYSYNEMDLLTEITDEGNKTVSFSHNEDGTINAVMNANGMNTVYDYDIDKNISGLNIDLNGQTLARNSYSYDGNGNRTVKEQLRGTTTYTYDDVNRLIKAQYPDCQEELFYDKAGNRTRRIANNIEEQYCYDVRSRLTSHIRDGVEMQYQYDNAGNLLNDGDRQYSYDGFNRTAKVTTNDGKVQVNKYDAEGLRYEIEENSNLVQFIFTENKEVVVEQTDENIKRLIRSFDLWASECTKEKTWYHYASDEQKLKEIIDTEIDSADDFISVEEVIAIEKKYIISLPCEYKEFICKYYGVFPKDDFWYKPIEVTPITPEDGFDSMVYFYGNQLEDNIRTYYENFGGKVIPIADSDGGDLICIGIEGEFRGKVFYWYHENEIDDDIDNLRQTLFLVANSFKEFILSFQYHKK